MKKELTDQEKNFMNNLPALIENAKKGNPQAAQQLLKAFDLYEGREDAVKKHEEIHEALRQFLTCWFTQEQIKQRDFFVANVSKEDQQILVQVGMKVDGRRNRDQGPLLQAALSSWSNFNANSGFSFGPPQPQQIPPTQLLSEADRLKEEKIKRLRARQGMLISGSNTEITRLECSTCEAEIHIIKNNVVDSINCMVDALNNMKSQILNLEVIHIFYQHYLKVMQYIADHNAEFPFGKDFIQRIRPINPKLATVLEELPADLPSSVAGELERLNSENNSLFLYPHKTSDGFLLNAYAHYLNLVGFETKYKLTYSLSKSFFTELKKSIPFLEDVDSFVNLALALGSSQSSSIDSKQRSTSERADAKNSSSSSSSSSAAHQLDFKVTNLNPGEGFRFANSTSEHVNLKRAKELIKQGEWAESFKAMRVEGFKYQEAPAAFKEYFSVLQKAAGNEVVTSLYSEMWGPHSELAAQLMDYMETLSTRDAKAISDSSRLEHRKEIAKIIHEQARPLDLPSEDEQQVSRHIKQGSFFEALEVLGKMPHPKEKINIYLNFYREIMNPKQFGNMYDEYTLDLSWIEDAINKNEHISPEVQKDLIKRLKEPTSSTEVGHTATPLNSQDNNTKSGEDVKASPSGSLAEYPQPPVWRRSPARARNQHSKSMSAQDAKSNSSSNSSSSASISHLLSPPAVQPVQINLSNSIRLENKPVNLEKGEEQSIAEREKEVERLIGRGMFGKALKILSTMPHPKEKNYYLRFYRETMDPKQFGNLLFCEGALGPLVIKDAINRNKHIPPDVQQDLINRLEEPTSSTKVGHTATPLNSPKSKDNSTKSDGDVKASSGDSGKTQQSNNPVSLVSNFAGQTSNPADTNPSMSTSMQSSNT